MIKSRKRAVQIKVLVVAVLLVILLAGTAAGIAVLGPSEFVANEDSEALALANGSRKREGRFDKVENGAEDDKDKKEDDKDQDKKESNEIKKETKVEHVEENGDVITTETIAENQDIAFGIEEQDEKNLPRGEVKVAQAGVTGVRTTYYKLTYKNGELLSKEETGSEVTKEPVKQVNLIGTSDYNLNTAHIQFYNNAKVTREAKSGPAFIILVDGIYYMTFWLDPVTWSSYTPSSALQIAGGQFTYDSKTYQYSIGPVDEGYALDIAFCNKYKLACGSW